MTRNPTSPLSLSIIIVCRDPWPALRRALDALYQQAVAVGAEIIVAVSDPGAIAPEAERLYPAVTWLQGKRDDSVFRLRALALLRCRGDIVALTEDHAWVEADWCRAILDAHAQYPDAAAIGGVVENGATASIADWASFFIVSGACMRPIHNGASDEISLQANVSYKRRALPASVPEFGLVQSIFHHELRQRGEKLVATDRVVVYHAQALTLGGHCAAHFHNGRSTAAFRLVAEPSAPWLCGCLLLPPIMLWRTLKVGLAKRRHIRELLMGLPLIMWLLCCHSAGELLGYCVGPGKSAQGVQ
jgi:hypothetical protein